MGLNKTCSTIVYLLFISLIMFVIKVIWVYQMPSPWVVDGFVYSETARAIINHHSILPPGLSSADYQLYPPGYPLFISLAYLFRDQELVYRSILVFNAFLTTLIIPITYYLALHYLNPERSLYTATITGCSPTLIPYIFVIMSENLFIPVFMLTIVVIFLATLRANTKFWLLAGFLTGFLVLVRIQGIAMVAALLAVLLWGWLKKTIKIKNCLAASLGTAVALGPYILYRLYSEATITGYPENYYVSNLYSSLTTITGLEAFLRLSLNELGYLYICGLGILTLLGFLFVINALKGNHLPSQYMSIYFGVSLVVTILITLLHMHGAYLGKSHMPSAWYEVFGRYLDPVITPLLVFGLIKLFKRKSYFFIDNSYSRPLILGLIIISLVFIVTFPCNTYHPGAMWAVIYLQYFKDIVPHQLVIAFVITLSAVVLMRSYKDWFKTACILIIFLGINLFAANFQIVNGNTETFGLWIKHQTPQVKVVCVDRSTPYHERLWRSATFWNPAIKVCYIDLEPGGLVNKTTFYPGRTVVITDKPLNNKEPLNHVFPNHKVYEITN